MNIVVVTSCVAGVAQSRLAARALTEAAQARGLTLNIEEQGGHKIPRRLAAADIERADVVVFAKAVAINGRERFAGKPTLEVSVRQALLDPVGVLTRAEDLVRQGDGA